MPHLTCWTDLAGQRVGVWGLGAEGTASVARLQALGATPVVVVDTPTPPGTQPPGSPDVLATTEGGFDALGECSVVVKSPGISRYRPDVTHLTDAGITVVGGLGLWLAEMYRHHPDAAVVCITGTKGKSTTASIMAHLAAGMGRRVFLGGNIGHPPWDPNAPDDTDLWVIETSSYQAADTEVGAPVVALTSLHPDHLPWHGDVDTYYRDKLSLATKPGTRITIAAATSPGLRAHTGELGDNVTWVDDTTFAGTWDAGLGLHGTHNHINAAIARACLVELGVTGATDDTAMTAAAAGFGGLRCRMEPAGTRSGVRFIDDSLSTNVLPTVAAVESLPGERLAVIVGGDDRGIDYTELGEVLAGRTDPTLVVAVYTTGPAIAAAVTAAATSGPSVTEVRACGDLATATTEAWQWAKPDGVVLLSPAAASFDAFDDYLHRSDTFRSAIADLSSDDTDTTNQFPAQETP